MNTMTDARTRWVYAFVKDPRSLLARAADALRPGGAMVMHEYVDYRAWRLSPRSEVFEGFVEEVIASWRATGGEPDIGLALPGWLAELGMEVRALTPLTFAPRVGDPEWAWPTAFVDTGVKRLIDLGRLDAAHGKAIADAYARTQRTPGAFQVTPTVIEIVALKP